MRITDVRTFLVYGGTPERAGWRHWLFVKVHTDTGLYGVGECWGWPRVVQTAIEDLKPLVVGEDPFLIERIWQKLYASTQGHGMTGVVGSGAITGIELALWDLKGKALDTPVWNLLGGKMRDRIRLYGHAFDEERARELVDRGFTAMKLFGWRDAVSRVAKLRSEYGPEIDLMVDAGGGPWQTPADAISLGRRLERYGLLFYEDPVSAVDIDGLARVAQAVDLPIAIGEAYPDVFALRPLIERGIIDVAQPDTGRFGGLWQMKKLAAIAEAHQVMVAPHQGSLGPVAEMAAIHLLATLPNYLIHEYLVNDVPQRYEVMTGQPVIEDGHILVPDRPGLGVDLDEEAINRYPPHGNAIPIDEDPDYDFQYVAAHRRRAAWLSPDYSRSSPRVG
ncbi:MAG: mandelate racemase/muconate lactonizing enzyme family protein [Spirochaetaceae bacterium]|nr:mandelate racemase/muconate lactonizing enzyme family protein [Spirochaetaceae bacterium]